ncbi:hypothetical protein LN736_06215 [Clostridium sp. WLY-B-L2]|uniref:Uncharacterized protein n=1 Tax=Clostridium aromativorans TaxID=2836848 RepID=A0ABS8N453_9CLOT|nr:hypothetical protein [Clostridium aromativorans]MCC9294451.1 hypothetical protein [Clostridium aromativorans]
MFKIKKPQNMRDSERTIKKVLDYNIAYIQTENEEERDIILSELEYWDIFYKLMIKDDYIWVIVDNNKPYNKALLQLLRTKNEKEALDVINRATTQKQKKAMKQAAEAIGIY